MIRVFSRNIVRFLLLVLIQVLVLNNIQLSGYINPYFYVLFVLLMPFETPGWVVILMGFLLGLTIDLFANTPGMHAAATAFMGYLRLFVLRYMEPRDGYEPGSFPRVYYYGFNWFLRYTLFLTFIHHLALFFIEAFHFTAAGHVLLRVVLSTFFSVLLIMISQYLVFRK
ncbi:MAG TPA: rod shape-determining protein MreD [Salinivirga sp.]|uniref:rod shape-determining protein MreD n=1 Tax=Salinivirga sp. TaxID=1970192 RepID=UPI002B48CADD|nr:rod shape-determining protein MreD [Salinivirga sp.]HKK58093.1 rod shape-determining protein MreD [Salinivirga sp.]